MICSLFVVFVVFARMKVIGVVLLVVLLVIQQGAGLDNGLGIRPAMVCSFSFIFYFF